MSAGQGETAGEASEERPEVEENSKGTGNSEDDHSDNESMSYKDSSASSMKDKGDYKSETNQGDLDKENTCPMKQQKQVRIADKHYSPSLLSEQSIIIISSYLVRAEEITVQGEMRIQKHSSGDVWYSLSFCDHPD